MEYKIKERLHAFKTLKRVEIDLIMLGFMYIDDDQKRKKIREARKLVLDLFDEVNKELEELKKEGDKREW